MVVNVVAVGAVNAGGVGVFRGWLFVVVVVEVTVNNILAKNKENRQKKNARDICITSPHSSSIVVVVAVVELWW